MRYTRAIVRPPPPTFAAGLTGHRGCPPDPGLALAQHGRYCQLLIDCGLSLTTLPADAAYPDSCFVEDTAIVTPRGAIATRPGAPSRMGEVDGIVEALRGCCLEVTRITAPGTLDGGDVCRIEEHFLVGLSARTNEEGARQLAQFLDALGYGSSVVDIRGQARLLHLKSGVSYVGEGRLVVVEDMSAVAALRPYERVVVADTERYAANCLRVNDRVLIAAGHPLLAETLSGLGCETVAVDLSEFRKMDGSLTCLSLLV
jgi:dimethylargininase